MCLQQRFDGSKAEDIIHQIDVNQVFRSSDFDLDTTLLQRAVDGANPHLTVEGICFTGHCQAGEKTMDYNLITDSSL